MRRRALCIFLGLFLVNGLLAQRPIDIAGKVENPIGLRLVHYYDASNQLTYQEILDQPFAPSQDRILNFGYNTGADWLSFSLHNTGGEELHQVLRINKPILDTLELYFEENGQLRKEMTGALVIKDREYEHSTSNYFRIKVSPNDTVKYHLKVVGMHSKQLAIYVTSDYEYAKYEQNSTIIMGFYLGVLIIITVYSLFLGFGIRDPLYLLYALSNFGSLVATLTLRGFFTGYIFNNQPELSLLFVPINITSFSVLSSFFCIRMINIKQYSKVAYYMFYAVVVFGILAVVYPYTLHELGHPSTFKLLSYGTMFSPSLR